MIEQCGYCGLTHDVGDGTVTFHGQVIKTCPMIAENQLVYVNQTPVVPDVDVSWFEAEENQVIDL